MDTEALRNKYRDEGLVLALGAGVSKASNIPDWEGLLNRVAAACLSEQDNAIPSMTDGRTVGLVAAFKERGLDLPAIASVLRARCGTEERFTQLVRDALYRDFPPYAALKERPPLPRDASPEARAEHRKPKLTLVREAAQSNATLRAVAALCVVRDADGRFRRNARIHGIVNFNLDAIFRTYVEAEYGAPLVRTVERASKDVDRGTKISVYHVHGFLRFDDKALDAGSESFDKLVLTEQNYYDFVSNPTGLFTYTFLHLLREHRCLFVGLSMQDSNLRRLLHHLYQERMAAYREENPRYSDEYVKDHSRRHFALLPRYEVEAMNDARAVALAELGVAVLPFDRFEQIPEILAEVYKGAGDWSRVYRDAPQS